MQNENRNTNADNQEQQLSIPKAAANMRMLIKSALKSGLFEDPEAVEQFSNSSKLLEYFSNQAEAIALENNKLRDKNAALTKDLENLVTQNKALVETNNDLQKKIDELTKRNEVLQYELDHFETDTPEATDYLTVNEQQEGLSVADAIKP